MKWTHLAVTLLTALGVSWVAMRRQGPPAPPPDPVPIIGLPAVVKGVPGRAVLIECVTQGTEVGWWTDDALGDLTVRYADGGKSVTYVAPKAGQYKVLAYTVVKGSPSPIAQCTVLLADPVPPVPPVPPKPPDPPVPPSPIPAKTLKVLFIRDYSALPGPQALIFTSQAIRQYLDAHCDIGQDGKTKDYRFFYTDADMSNESDAWKTAFSRPRKSVPWICIGSGTSGTEEPLPANEADTLALLKKFGGP